MKDTEHGFSATADELAQVLLTAGGEMLNNADNTTDFYHAVLMGAAGAMIMGMRKDGAKNTPIEIEIMTDADDDDFAEERDD